MPKVFQGIVFLTALQYRLGPVWGRRYGSPFTINLPIFGKTVVVSDPILVKDVYGTSSDLIERPTKILGQAFGPGSTFSLTGDEHLQRRKLVLPNFHGKRVQNYERLIEEEVIRETANWPEGREFQTLPTMGRLTLNAILRAVFGEEKHALDELRSRDAGHDRPGLPAPLLPPIFARDFGRWSPGGRLLHTGTGSTLSSTRSSPMRGPTRLWQSAATSSHCCCKPATTTASRSRIGISPTSY